MVEEDHEYAIIIPPEIMKQGSQRVSIWMIGEVGLRLQDAIRGEIRSMQEAEQRYTNLAHRSADRDDARRNFALAQKERLKRDGAELALAQAVLAANYAKSATIMYEPPGKEKSEKE